jgi:hypothetical protein
MCCKTHCYWVVHIFSFYLFYFVPPFRLLLSVLLHVSSCLPSSTLSRWSSLLCGSNNFGLIPQRVRQECADSSSAEHIFLWLDNTGHLRGRFALCSPFHFLIPLIFRCVTVLLLGTEQRHNKAGFRLIQTVCTMKPCWRASWDFMSWLLAECRPSYRELQFILLSIRARASTYQTFIPTVLAPPPQIYDHLGLKSMQ